MQEKAKAAAEAAAQQPSAASKEKKQPRTNKQKLEAAVEAKESGNKHFVDLNYPDAVRRYTQVHIAPLC